MAENVTTKTFIPPARHGKWGMDSDSDGFMFQFEKNFDGEAGKEFINNNWPLVFGVISLYLAFVTLAPTHLMKNRPRFEIRIPLIIWSWSLAIFSCLALVRVFPKCMDKIFRGGWHTFVCDNSYFTEPVLGFWSFVFTMSKLIELGDTVFIVLRKQPLIFLHWYHHITVLLYCWFGNTEFSSTGMFFGLMNYLVHTLMYTYYALKAMRVRIPRAISLFITATQLSQMVFGIGMNVFVYNLKKANVPCAISDINLQLAFLMYASYFVLFADFFYKAYIRKGVDKDNAVAHTAEKVISQAQMLAKKAM